MRVTVRSVTRLAVLGALLVAANTLRVRAARDAAAESARVERVALATAPPSRADSLFADSVLVASGMPGPDVRSTTSGLAAPERDPARIARTLATRSAGSYIGDMLAARDSMNFRWPDRRTTPMRVWVQEPPSGSTGSAPFTQIVRDAFDTWGDAGVPIRFSFVLDSAGAEIRVTWVEAFDPGVRMTGRTRWVHDQHGWIVAGSIELATHQQDGRALDADAVRAIALHEAGHLLGLDHANDASSVMSSRIQVAELSEADRITVRLVYLLPPGTLKGVAPR